MDTNNALLAIAALLLTNILAAFVTAATARSKGRSYGLFFVLSIISWLIIAAVVIFISPKTGEKTRPKLSSLALLVIGFVIEAWGIGQLKLDPNMTDTQLANVLSSPNAVGAIVVATAGVLLVIGAIASERVKLATPAGQ